MTTHYDLDTLPHNLRTVVTVGSFDGVHSGHKVLLRHLTDMAHRLDAESVVVSFDPHPRIVMGRGEGLSLLTSTEERALLLERCGIDRFVVVRFDDKFRSQSYEHFVRSSLVDSLGMAGMVVGYNHRFGRGSEGNYERLLPLGAELGFEVERVEQYTDLGDKVSSTVVRQLLESGDMVRAAEIMGHPYLIIAESHSDKCHISDRYKLIPTDGEYNAKVNGRAMTLSVEGRDICLSEGVSGRVEIEFINRL